MYIKLKASEIIKATENFFSSISSMQDFSLDPQEVTENLMFIQMNYKRNIEFFSDLRDMAMSIQHSNYPYLLINNDEFRKISKYMRGF